MKFKKVITLMLAMMMLASCSSSSGGSDRKLGREDAAPANAEEDVDKNVSDEEETAEDEAVTTAATTKAGVTTGETTTGAETTTDESNSNKVLPMSSAKKFPDTAFAVYNENKTIYIIDNQSGELLSLLSKQFFDDRGLYAGNGMKDGFFKAEFWGGDNVYIDSNNNIIEAPAEVIIDPDIINGLEIKSKDGFYGVSGTKGKTVIDYIYHRITGNADYSMFLVEINNAWGLVNNKNEVIIPPGKNYNNYNNLFKQDSIEFYDDIAIVWTVNDNSAKIYDNTGTMLSTFIGKYDYIGNGRFLVYQSADKDLWTTKVIDKSGNVIKEDFGLPADMYNLEKYGDYEIASQDTVGGKKFVLVGCKYQVNKYGSETTALNVMDENGKILLPWNKTGIVNFDYWVVNNNYFTLTVSSGKTSWDHSYYSYVFDYSGALKHTFVDIKFLWAGNDIFITGDINNTYNWQLFTLYNSAFEPIHTMTDYEIYGNTVITTDEGGVFYGMYVGETLVQPFEYTSGSFEKDMNANTSLVKLMKGNETTYVTTATGAVVNCLY
jgi:hypothetical protein